MSTTHLLYLHGFRSSPLSTKARQLCRAVHAQRRNVLWWSPQLPPSPADASRLIAEGTADWPREHMAVVGSSLGGFYATWLAEKKRCKAVLLNPAVRPARDLAASIGELALWHAPEQHMNFRPEYIEQLQQLQTTSPVAGERYLAIIAKGDEVLDWHEMTAHYAGAQRCILEGGDHALSDFASHIARILAFLGLQDAGG